MSEPQPSLEPVVNSGPSNTRTLLFMVILSFVCALILSILASLLAKPKEIAKDLDRSKQMMIAARILDHNGYFLMPGKDGKYIPAKYHEGGYLVPGSEQDLATNDQLLEIYRKRLIPKLTDSEGSITDFEKEGIDEEAYIADFKKTGYYRQKYKLFYEIMPNLNPAQKENLDPVGYVIPVNGYGLWDAIYGYIAIAPNGDDVIGISWYDQKETPGLGANIAEAYWQDQFPGKKIFQENASGDTNFKLAPMGIIVVKGKVADVLGASPKSKSAVDGMAGATLTGNGVTDAYREVLSSYRPFFIKLHHQQSEQQG